MAYDGKLVEREQALILSIDGLVCQQTRGGDHVGGHTIT
jgi:hypothetical protein